MMSLQYKFEQTLEAHMQITAIPRNMRKFGSYALTHEVKPAHKNLQKYGKKYVDLVEKWERLKNNNLSVDVIQQTIGISQATYYRYKKQIMRLSKGLKPLSKRPHHLRKSKVSKEIIDNVLKIRTENPTYGKTKIAVILKRDYNLQIGATVVGKVIKKLKEEGKITTSKSASKPKRKRKFESHAQRWKYGMKGTEPGEMIQIDHMSVHVNQINLKHFQAWDPSTRTIFADIASRATGRTAATFLKNLVENLPFPVKSIQADGGSEFMAEFEEAAQKMNIPLFVLPPRRPQWNGGVERGNRIFREEFYADPNLLADNMKDMREALKAFLLKYNGYRPHHQLKGLTPMEYTKIILKTAS